MDAKRKGPERCHMRLGEGGALRSGWYGGDVDNKGTVTGLDMGTGSAFSLLPAQNASGNWIKIVQRVPVRIAIDAKQLAEHPLRIGLSMKAEVSLRDQKGEVLPTAAAKGTVFDTDVYAKQLHDADEVIHTIIEGNLPQQANAG